MVVDQDPRGNLVTSCPKCLLTVPADPADHEIVSERVAGSDTITKYTSMIRGAGKDPINAKIPVTCPACKKYPYLTIVRIPKTEQTIFTCSCGYVSMEYPHDS